MSHFCGIQLLIKDSACLLEALIEMGWKLEQIEIHEPATNLYGFEGDKRKDVANIIIRRRFVGSASNDIGFFKESDGNYTAIISEYDRSNRYGDTWLNKLKQQYGIKVVERQAKLKGMSVKKSTKEDGTIQLILQKAG